MLISCEVETRTLLSFKRLVSYRKPEQASLAKVDGLFVFYLNINLNLDMNAS